MNIKNNNRLQILKNSILSIFVHEDLVYMIKNFKYSITKFLNAQAEITKHFFSFFFIT